MEIYNPLVRLEQRLGNIDMAVEY